MSAGKVIYSCPFVPAEWIAAHGFTPSRITPESCSGKGPVDAAPGICPFARAFANTAAASDASAVVLTTACDQMRRGYDIVEHIADKPVFLMNVPNTWESVGSLKLYKSELERLGRCLISLGGFQPSSESLTAVMRDYNAKRSLIRGASGSMSGKRYFKLLTDFNMDPSAPVSDIDNRHLQNGIPLALLGGPMMKDHASIYDHIEAAGGSIVLDAAETGERALPAPFDLRRIADDPMSVLIESYFGSIPDAARRPNNLLYQWLQKEIKVREIKGIVYIRYVWCDIWHAEAQRIKEWFGLPFFDLDITEDAGDTNRRLTRLQAFMEMLK